MAAVPNSTVLRPRSCFALRMPIWTLSASVNFRSHMIFDRKTPHEMNGLSPGARASPFIGRSFFPCGAPLLLTRIANAIFPSRSREGFALVAITANSSFNWRWARVVPKTPRSERVTKAIARRPAPVRRARKPFLRPTMTGSKWLAPGGLPLQQERLGKFALAANLERSEVLVPRPVWSLRFGFPPKFKLIEVLNRYPAFFQAIEKVLSNGTRKIGPLDLPHHSPKVMRASSSLSRFRSADSTDSASRVASSKNRSFSASLD